MTLFHVSSAARTRAIATFPWAMLTYWLTIFPSVGRELSRWRRAADAIPDPTLRHHAIGKLDAEHLTAEGAAAFAILVPRQHRDRLVRACVAFEVMYDYLDALTEEHPTLANNRSLHRALRAAVDLRSAVPLDLYAHHPQRDDGGYLTQIAGACRDELAQMPREATVSAALVVATERAAEAQSLNHATSRSSPQPLIAWAVEHRQDGLEWWETAAAAGAPMVIFALIAAACEDATSPASARAVEHAYFPWVSALEWLLEGIADEADDDASGTRSYVSHYRTPDDLGRRLSAISERAITGVSQLPRRERHLLLVAGMIGMLLSDDGAQHARRDAAAVALNASLGGLVSPFLVMLRVRRSAKGVRRRVGLRVSALTSRRWRVATGRRRRARRRCWHAISRR